MNNIVSDQEYFKKMWVYAVFIQVISATIIGQLPTFNVFKKVRTVLESEF